MLHVFEKDTTFNDDDEMGRAIGSSVIQNVAYLPADHRLGGADRAHLPSRDWDVAA